MKRNLSLNILLAAAVVFLAVQAALATPTPVPIPISPTPPTPPPPEVKPTPAVVCVWIQVTGPGPHPFEPAPGQDIRDMEIDIPGGNDGSVPVPYPEGSEGPWGPFNSYELLDSVFDPAEGILHEGVGHWYDGIFLEGTYIIVEWPDAEPGQTWYVHFTPEPATMAMLGLGAVALIRKRRK